MAHFWMSYGRCTMPGLPMRRSEGLLDVGQVRCFHEETSRKLLFWKGDTKDSDTIPAKKEPCLTPTLMDVGQAINPNTTYNEYKMEFWKFA